MLVKACNCKARSEGPVVQVSHFKYASIFLQHTIACTLCGMPWVDVKVHVIDSISESYAERSEYIRRNWKIHNEFGQPINSNPYFPNERWS